MSQKPKQISRKRQKNPNASKSSEVPHPMGPKRDVPPPPSYESNFAPPTPIGCLNPLVYYPNPSSTPQLHPQAIVAENYELKARIESLENAFEKLSYKSQEVTLIQTQKKNKSKNESMSPEPTHLGSLQPRRLMSIPLLPNPIGVEICRGTSKISTIPAKSKDSSKKPHSNEKKTQKKSRGSSAKSPAQTLVTDAKNIKSVKKGNDGSNISLEVQQNPKNKGQPKPYHPKKILSKDNFPANLNYLTVDRNSLPKGQPKLEKKVPSEDDLKKDQEKVWQLYVIINADIDITSKLSDYLNERLKQKIIFKVQSITKDKTTGFVTFLLKFKSKHQMTMAKRLFNSSNKKNSIKLDCKMVGGDKYHKNKPSTLGNNLKCQNDGVQQQHEKKIENIRKEITSLLSSVGGTFSAQQEKKCRVNALEHKEKELLFQLAEYRNTRTDLETQLKKLRKDKKEDSIEVEKIVKRLDQEHKFLLEAQPLYAIRTKITETVLKNQVTILMGNCESGKSNQLVQFLMETSLIDDGPIVHTKPSEIQALSTAKHVADEVNSSLGNLVGFSSEKDFHLSIHTNVLFMSEHELLEQFQKMNSFDAYSCIIIDEVQERTVYADLLLGLLKLELCKIPRLRIVIVTASAEVGIYQSFFTDSVLLELNTCSFPVQVLWCDVGENQAQLPKKSAVEKAMAVHCTEDEGNILVFVASDAEVHKCCTDFKSNLKENNYVCLPLYDGINYDQLKGIYRPLSSGKRKIIFSTSCAELMYAVPNVKYVIDTGVKKERFLESGNKNQLPISFISQDSAKHRKEKAGSSFWGKCYRLYSPNDYKGMKTTKLDEMSLAGSIEKAVINLLKLNIDPIKFEFPASISEERISSAIRNLVSIGAVLHDSAKYKITDMGTKMSKLPFRFPINWMLLEGINQGAIMESIALASLSNLKQEVFCIEEKYGEMMQVEHQKFGPPSDSIALRTLRVVATWYKQPKKKKDSWCAEHFLDISSIKFLTSQMNDLCKTLTNKLKLNVKFGPLLPLDNPNNLEELIDEALTKFTSSLEEHS